jgi:DNA polymerase-3 subunit chi
VSTGIESGTAPGSSGLDPRSSILNPRIDFHFNVEHRLHYACRVVRKARAAGKTVLAWTADADRLARFDAALWTFSALDFIPHVYAGTALAEVTPVVLTAMPVDAARDVLLALDDAPAPGFAQWFCRFERVIDVVSRDDAERAHARARFKLYRDSGLAPAHHDMADA